MSKNEILEKLKNAIIDLGDEDVSRLVKEGLEAGLSPAEIINHGLGAGLTVLGEGFANAERFMSELMIAGQIMTDVVEMLRPVMEKSGRQLGDTMILGTVQNDLHDIGRKIVGAMFTGAGYTVIDIGGDAAASEFVKAAKEHKAIIVGASAILTPVMPYCKVINDALVDAGIRDDVIYIVGGSNMTQRWSDDVGADCYGQTAIDAVHKIKMIRAGELPKIKKRLGK